MQDNDRRIKNEDLHTARDLPFIRQQPPYLQMLVRGMQGGEIMLTATGTIRNQWNKEEVTKFEHEFARTEALEDFLAYNRAYIITLSFTGKFTREEDN